MLATQINSAIRSVVGEGSVALHEPEFSGNELLYLQECLNSTYVSSLGPFVNKLESELSSYTGAKHVVAVVNGTAALHIALKLAGVLSGDEVLVPALTFVATANAVVYCGATPHFVDGEINTLGIDPKKLRDYLQECSEQHFGKCINRSTGKIIRALVPMHTFGHPVDLDNLLAIAHDFNIAVVEDAAEGLGSYYFGKHVGTFGLLGTLSFNGNKIITTGGGGAILTNSDSIARHVRHLVTTAKLAHPWEFRHDEVGFNYRLPNLNAALGCAQLERLANKLSAKRSLYFRYKAAFNDVLGVRLVAEPNNCSSNYWLQTLLLDSENSHERDLILKQTNDNGIMTRPSWALMNELLPFKDCPSMDISISKSLAQRLINIPSSTYQQNLNYE